MSKSFRLEIRTLLLLAVCLMAGSCSVLKSAERGDDKVETVVNGNEQNDSIASGAVKKERVRKSVKQMSYNRVYRIGTPYDKFCYAMLMFENKRFERAIGLFDDAYPFFVNQPQADSLVYFRALSHFRRGNFQVSCAEFDRFRKRFGQSDFIEEAEFLYAKGYYYMSPKTERDQTTTLQAISTLSDYLDRYPKTSRREEINGYIAELRQKLYDKELLNAKVYYDVGHHKSAVYALKNLLANQPETTHREEVMYLIVKSSFNLAENSVEELQHSRYLDTIDNYYDFISEYPETKYRKEVDKIFKTVQKYVNKQKDNNKESEDGNQEERSE